MVFPTLEFVLFFGAVLGLSLVVGCRLRNAFLIAVSYLFYAAWDWRFCGLLATASLVAWLGGLGVARPSLRVPARVVSITVLLGILGFFKYYGFFLLSLSQLLESVGLGRDLPWMSVVLPVGISFYTFQAISYVMDVQRGHVAARRNPGDVFLYISFFPQLVAGPIVRAADFLPQIDRPHVVDAAARGAAVLLILSGLFKKMVIANYVSVLLVDPVFAFPGMASAGQAAAGIVGYGVQIYCDFSGYTDIAIGIALLLGYRFPPNFNQPYRAGSLSEFWRRWHISLSSWIRDYVYIPMGGNRGTPLRRSAVLMATMTLAGLWHGAGWNFLLWGSAHGAGLLTERALPWLKRPGLGWIWAMSLVFLLWVPFRAESFADTMAVFAALGQGGWGGVALPGLVLVALGLAMNWLPLGWRAGVQSVLVSLGPVAQAAVLAAGTVLIFALAQDGVAPFIYFQF